MACRSKTIALSTKFLSPAEADKHYNSQEETSFTPRVSSDGTSLQSSEIFEECKWLLSLPSTEQKRNVLPIIVPGCKVCMFSLEASGKIFLVGRCGAVSI